METYAATAPLGLRETAGYRANLPLTAEAQLERGMALYAQGQRMEGVALYRNALRLEPENVLGHFVLGLALMAMREADEARREWQAVLSLPARGERSGWAQQLAITLLERYPPQEGRV